MLTIPRACYVVPFWVVGFGVLESLGRRGLGPTQYEWYSGNMQGPIFAF